MKYIKERYCITLFTCVIAAIITYSIIIFAYNSYQHKNKDNDNNTDTMSAMYLPITEDVCLFVSLETNAVFTIQFPDEIYDIYDNKITKDDLQKGNIVRIYGNNIMTNSYPGQYHGVDKLVVIKIGRPTDADIHQDVMDQFYQEPDPATLPMLDVKYTTNTAHITAMIQHGNYDWTYSDENGDEVVLTREDLPIMEWKTELNNIKLQEDLDLVLSFSKEPESVKVVCWNLDKTKNATIDVIMSDDAITIPIVNDNFIYEVIGEWSNGSVTYGFMTVSS